MQKIFKVKFKCVAGPEDAVNLNINIIHGADARNNLACNYRRFLKKDGIYSYHHGISFRMDSRNLEQNYLLPSCMQILVS